MAPHLACFLRLRAQWRGLPPWARQMGSVSLQLLYQQTTKEKPPWCSSPDSEWDGSAGAAIPAWVFKGRGGVGWVQEGGLSLTQLHSDFYRHLRLVGCESRQSFLLLPSSPILNSCKKLISTDTFICPFIFFLNIYWLAILHWTPGLGDKIINNTQFCPKDHTI